MSDSTETKKAIFNEMLKTGKAKMLSDLNIKEKEDSIKESYARIHQLKNKKGDLQPGQVKMGPMKSAISLFREEGKKDTIAENYDLREEYLTNIKNEVENKNGNFFPINELESFETTIQARTELPSIDDVKRKRSDNDDITDEEILGMEIISKSIVAKTKETELENREIAKAEEEGRSPKKKKAKKESLKDTEKEKAINDAIENLLKVLGLDRKDIIS